MNSMKILTKLIEFKQLKLILLSIVISVCVFIILMAFAWHQSQNQYIDTIVGYKDKAAYEKCIEKAKSIKHPNTDSEITQFLDCEAKWSKWGRIKKKSPSLNNFIFSSAGEKLIVLTAMTFGIYIMLLTYILYMKCSIVGWRRLSRVVAIIPAILVALIILGGTGYKISVGEYLLTMFGASAGYFLGVFLILGSRYLIIWIKEGFKSPE